MDFLQILPELKRFSRLWSTSKASALLHHNENEFASCFYVNSICAEINGEKHGWFADIIINEECEVCDISFMYSQDTNDEVSSFCLEDCKQFITSLITDLKEKGVAISEAVLEKISLDIENSSLQPA